MKVDRRSFLSSAAASSLAFGIPIGPLKAWIHGFDYQKTVQNIGTMGSIEYNFINFAKSAFVLLGTNSPTLLNDDGYPSSTLTANLTMYFTLPQNSSGVKWVLKWTGTLGDGSHGHLFETGINVTNTISGAVNSGGSGTGSTVFSGTNGHFEFYFTSMPLGPNALTTYIQSGSSFSSYSNLILCRATDESAITLGAIWNPDFISSLTTLGPSTIRLMGPTINSGSECLTNPQWKYRTPTTALSYKPNTGRLYVTNLWCVTPITNSGNAYTAPSYPDMPTSYTDGEVFMGSITAIPTSAAVTSVASSSGKVKLTLDAGVVATLTTGSVISYNGYGISGNSAYSTGIWVITVLNSTDVELTTGYQTGAASVYATFTSGAGTVSTASISVGGRPILPLIGGSSLLANTSTGLSVTGNCYFVYKSLLNAVCATSGPLYTGLNPELSVNLCNTLNMNYWFNLTLWATDSTAQSAITYIRDNLNSNLNCVFEWSNEIWNFGAAQFNPMWYNGIALNIPDANNLHNAYSYAGLRVAQLVDLMQPIWSATRSPSQFKPILTNWPLGQFHNEFNLYACQGSYLNASTNSVLSAYTGGKSYNAGSPTFNRPVDKCRLISFAPYVYLDNTISGIYTMAQQYATGQQATALASFDAAVRAATTSYAVPVTGAFPIYEALCAGYDGSGRPAGMGNLEVWCYEGGLQISFPTVSGSGYVGYTNTITATQAATFNIGSSPSVNWASHGLQNGCRVTFSTVPGFSISANTDYYVCNATTNAFDISSTNFNGPSVPVAIVLSGTPSGNTTVTGSQFSIDNLYVGWNNSASYAPPWVSFYNTQFQNMSSFPHFRRVSFLQLEGWASGNKSWSLYPGDMDTTPFQTYSGIATFNSNAL